MDWQVLLDNDSLISTLTAVGIFLLFLVFRKLFSKYVFKFILKITKKTPTDFLTFVWLSFEKPLRWLFVVIGIYVAAHYFPYINPKNPLFLDIYRSSIIILITWGLINVSSTSSALFHKLNNRMNLEIDQILIPFLSKALRFIIILISFSVILQEFDYSISGLVAGLGIGGLAISLAAQDVIKNFLGGVVIIFEKPFSIGDYVSTSNVEGTVEDITFRSTIIRTDNQALVTVPNSILASSNITNFSKVERKKVEFRLGIAMNTSSEKLEHAIHRLQDYIKNKEAVQSDTVVVTLDKLSETSLELLFSYFVSTTVSKEFLAIKEDINLKVMEILREENIEVASPIQKFYVMEHEDEVKTEQKAAQ